MASSLRTDGGAFPMRGSENNRDLPNLLSGANIYGIQAALRRGPIGAHPNPGGIPEAGLRQCVPQHFHQVPGTASGAVPHLLAAGDSGDRYFPIVTLGPHRREQGLLPDLH